jgi:ubiquinone/menaquinone biosynthesis C-methylase UbiE
VTTQRAFVPAAGQDRWLPFYDPLSKLLGAPSALRALIAQADVRPGQRVLDIGCGTGTLAVMLKQSHPQIEVVALDPDANALDRARRKADQAGVEIRFARGFADAIPSPDASFDRVLSSFMLHHLTHDEQQATLAEVFRAVKPGGSFHVLDFAGHDRPRGLIARLLHRDEDLHDHTEGRICAMLGAAGFKSGAEVGTRRTLFGPISFYRADR